MQYSRYSSPIDTRDDKFAETALQFENESDAPYRSLDIPKVKLTPHFKKSKDLYINNYICIRNNSTISNNFQKEFH